MDTEKFVKKAKEIHGDKYDYSKVFYTNRNTEVCIICPNHGEFWQKPSNHLRGYGCKKCQYEIVSEKLSSNTDEFLEKSRKIYGDMYDFSKVKYVNSSSKVCIICPKHGEFFITPNDFLDGHGCPECAKVSRNEKLSSGFDKFLKKAKEIHGDKYDYSKVDYVNSSTKVCIICPKHGEFWQTPHAHLNGLGCKKCGVEKRVSERKLSLDDFIERANKIHDNKYDYSLVTEFKNVNQKVPIICPKHGLFYQIVCDHLHGCGCKKCYRSKMEESISCFLENKKIDFIYRCKDFPEISELDFYLPEYNVAIECQGRQHFEPVNFGGRDISESKNEYEKIIERDIKKRKICEDLGIRLLYFSNVNIIYPYKVFTNKMDLLKEIRHG